MGGFARALGGIGSAFGIGPKGPGTPDNYVTTFLNSSDKTLKAMSQKTKNELTPEKLTGEKLRVLGELLSDPNKGTLPRGIAQVKPLLEQIKAGKFKPSTKAQAQQLARINASLAKYAEQEKAAAAAQAPASSTAPAPSKTAAPVPVAAETPAAAAATSIVGTHTTGTISADTSRGGSRPRRRGRVASLLGGLGSGGSETFGG